MSFIKSLLPTEGLWGTHSFFFSQRKRGESSIYTPSYYFLKKKKKTMIFNYNWGERIWAHSFISLTEDIRDIRQRGVRPGLCWRSSQSRGESGMEALGTPHPSAATRAKCSTNSPSTAGLVAPRMRKPVAASSDAEDWTLESPSPPHPSELSFLFTRQKHQGSVFLTQV